MCPISDFYFAWIVFSYHCMSILFSGKRQSFKGIFKVLIEFLYAFA